MYKLVALHTCGVCIVGKRPPQAEGEETPKRRVPENVGRTLQTPEAQPIGTPPSEVRVSAMSVSQGVDMYRIHNA